MADDPLSDDFNTRFGTVAAPPPTATPPQPGVTPLTTVNTPLGPQPVPPAPTPPPTGVSTPWASPGAPGAASPAMRGPSPEYNQALTDTAAAIKAQIESQTQGRAAMAPLIDAQIKRMGEPLPTPPAPQALPPVPNREEVMSSAEQAMMALATFAGIIGGRGRTHATNALAAMTGAIDGMVEGNKEKFEQNAKQFDMESKRAQQVYQEQRNHYLDIIQNRTLRDEEMKMQLALLAQRYQDPGMQQTVGNLTQLAQLFEGRDRLAAEEEEYRLGLRGVLGRFGTRTPISASAVDLSAALAKLGNPQAIRGYSAISGVPAEIRNRLAADADGTNPLSAEVMQQAQAITSSQLSYTGEQSYQRTAGGFGARVESASNEVVTLLPLAVQASDELPRGKFVPINQITQTFLRNTSDPSYNRFITANNGLITAYAKAMNPTGVPREGDKHIMDQIGILNTAISPEAYRAQALQMAKEVRSSKNAVAKTREGGSGTDDLDELIRALEPAGKGTPVPATAPNKTPSGITWGPG